MSKAIIYFLIIAILVIVTSLIFFFLSQKQNTGSSQNTPERQSFEVDSFQQNNSGLVNQSYDPPLSHEMHEEVAVLSLSDEDGPNAVLVLSESFNFDMSYKSDYLCQDNRDLFNIINSSTQLFSLFIVSETTGQIIYQEQNIEPNMNVESFPSRDRNNTPCTNYGNSYQLIGLLHEKELPKEIFFSEIKTLPNKNILGFVI